ncbi:MAG TPA: (Fe-S)-binding protein [Candidatus Deferrimicrobium sp.]|nr:(Fe-S)-binding protein [Candidatus Deferrimicrobium sp.]
MTEKTDFLRNHIDDMWLCARCSLCKFPPLAQIKSHRFSSVCCSMDYGYFHAWSGSGKIIMGLSLLEKRVEEISETMRDAILQCSLCGACDVSCKYSTNIEVFDTIFDVRRYFVQTIGAHPIHSAYLQKAQKFHNPYGEPHEKRQTWIDATKVIPNPDSKTLFFTGCTGAYRQKEMVQASVEILAAGNVDFRVSAEEQCCGSPIYRSGQVSEAIPLFEHTLQLFAKEGLQEVITACPGCYAMFVAEYPKHLQGDLFDIWSSIKFRHMVEVIEELIAKKKIQFKDAAEKTIVTYHDPCHLGRGGEPWVPEWKGSIKKVFNQIKVYDPPKNVRRGTKGIYKPVRNILKSMTNIEFTEMFRINEYAYCCGSGGGVKAAYPEMALASATERLEEAEAVLKSKADELAKANIKVNDLVLVSACPFCKTNFEDGIKSTGKKIRYLDINQLTRDQLKTGDRI